MDLMEYKAKELFGRYGLPITKGLLVDDLDDLMYIKGEISYPVVVKAQVQTGGRGKAGGIKFAENHEDLLETGRSILGMNIKGHVVKKLLLAEKLEVRKEWYLSIILDRLTKSPTVIFSPVGGMDIEETACMTPEKVLKVSIDPFTGVKDYLPRYLLSKSGCSLEYFEQLYEILKKLYSMFCGYNCMLAEINPLAVTPDNSLVALDGKISIDDSALGRLPDILEYRDSLQEDERVLDARKFGFLYIPCEDKGDIGVISNGSGMIMSCIDLMSKQGMSVGAALDLGGGATAERIQEAIRIILSNNKIKALFINIFGGITRCDEVAAGVMLAMEKLSGEKLVIVRFEGTNKEKGLEIMSSIKGNVVSVDGLIEGVKELNERRREM